MSAAPRLSSADHVLINAVGWVTNNIMGDDAMADLMLSTVAEVLPAVTPEIPIIQKLARIGAEMISAARAKRGLGLLRGDAQRALMEFHASRVGDALEVFRKGSANAA